MRRPGKNQLIVRQVKAYLEELPEEVDVDELATELVVMVRTIDAEAKRYGVLVINGAYGVAYGPYTTYAEAQKAIRTGSVPVLKGERIGVVSLYHPDDAAARTAAQSA